MYFNGLTVDTLLPFAVANGNMQMCKKHSAQPVVTTTPEEAFCVYHFPVPIKIPHLSYSLLSIFLPYQSKPFLAM